MAYSSIIKKKCKCGCNHLPSISYDGWYAPHAPEEIKEKVGNKRKASIKRKNERSAIARKAMSLPQNKISIQDKLEMDRWFIERAKEMTGVCSNCGGETTKGNQKYWKYSICHILEKKNFHSVRVHPLNFIELCYFGNSCHSQMDNKILEMQDMKCWNEIQNKFHGMYQSISKEEYRFIPNVLMQSL